MSEDIEPKSTPLPFKENQGAPEATPVVDMDFFDALRAAVDGKKIHKKEWENKEIYGIFKENILKLHKEDEKLHDWILSMEDVKGDDWIVV